MHAPRSRWGWAFGDGDVTRIKGSVMEALRALEGGRESGLSWCVCVWSVSGLMIVLLWRGELGRGRIDNITAEADHRSLPARNVQAHPRHDSYAARDKEVQHSIRRKHRHEPRPQTASERIGVKSAV